MHDHINAIIEAIRAECVGDEPVQFDMRSIHTHNECGTVACILGYSDLIADEKVDSNEVSQRLGITREEERGLLFGLGDGSWHIPLSTITKDHAILALETIRDTGRFPGWDAILQRS